MGGAKIGVDADFRDLLRAFVDHDVRFLIVGAYRCSAWSGGLSHQQAGDGTAEGSCRRRAAEQDPYGTEALRSAAAEYGWGVFSRSDLRRGSVRGASFRSPGRRRHEPDEGSRPLRDLRAA